jgi:hypothetical protein
MLPQKVVPSGFFDRCDTNPVVPRMGAMQVGAWPSPRLHPSHPFLLTCWPVCRRANSFPGLCAAPVRRDPSSFGERAASHDNRRIRCGGIDQPQPPWVSLLHLLLEQGSDGARTSRTIGCCQFVVKHSSADTPRATTLPRWIAFFVKADGQTLIDEDDRHALVLPSSRA